MNAPFDLIPDTTDNASLDRPLVIANVSRRRFLQEVSALGGLVLAVGFQEAVRAADPPKYGADGMPHGWVDSPLVFVAINENGIVSIVCHRAEMGQGVRTGMPMIVADELEADWKRVRVVQAPGDEERFGNQDTDGSRSTRHFFEPMRRCGAAARQMLEAAAAARWKVPIGEVEAKNHEVVHRPTGRRLGYGSLAKAAAGMPVPAREAIRLKDPAQFRYIGKGELKLVDGQDIATGKAQYGIDTRLPGMLYAVVARPPVYGGKVEKLRRRRGAQGAGRGTRSGNRVEFSASPFQSPGRGCRCRAEHLGRDAGPQGAEDRVGRRTERQLRLHGLQGGAREVGAAVRRRSCATTETSPPLRRAPRAASRRSITSRISPMRPWNRPPQRRASRKTSARCGAASSRPRPPATWLRNGSACPPRTSPCTSRCSAEASDGSPSPTTASRRRCCPRRWTASPSR